MGLLPASRCTKAYLRDNIDIQIVEFAEIPNQSVMYFQPTHNTHRTYPADAIVKFIDEHANKQHAEEPTEMTRSARQPVSRDPYINCEVRKKFGRKYYKGKVDHAWFGKDAEIHYHVIYDDEETEDLTMEELKVIVIQEP